MLAEVEKRGEAGEREVQKFQWRSLNELVDDFRENLQLYTDAFSFFVDSGIIEEIRLYSSFSSWAIS